MAISTDSERLSSPQFFDSSLSPVPPVWVLESLCDSKAFCRGPHSARHSGSIDRNDRVAWRRFVCVTFAHSDVDWDCSLVSSFCPPGLNCHSLSKGMAATSGPTGCFLVLSLRIRPGFSRGDMGLLRLAKTTSRDSFRIDALGRSFCRQQLDLVNRAGL